MDDGLRVQLCCVLDDVTKSRLEQFFFPDSNSKKLFVSDSKDGSSVLMDSFGGIDYLLMGREDRIVVLVRCNMQPNNIVVFSTTTIDIQEGGEISALRLMAIPSKRVKDSVDGVFCVLGTLDGRLLIVSDRGKMIHSEAILDSPISSIRFSSDGVVLCSSSRVVLVDNASVLQVIADSRKGKPPRNLESSCLVWPRDGVVDACHAPASPSSFSQYQFASSSSYYGRSDKFKWSKQFWTVSDACYGEMVFYEEEKEAGVRSTLANWTNQYISSYFSLGTPKRELHHSFTRRLEKVSRGVWMSPAPSGYPFVAMTDSLARVLLVHVPSCQSVRIWKGYRDAKCHWIVHSNMLFLVIFAPRRSLIELWNVPDGKRIGARRTNGIRMLTNETYLMGRGLDGSPSKVFVLCSSGNIYQLSVDVTRLSDNDDEHDTTILAQPDAFSRGVVPLIHRLRTPMAKRRALLTWVHQIESTDECRSVIEALNEVPAVHSITKIISALERVYSGLREMSARTPSEIALPVQLEEVRPQLSSLLGEWDGVCPCVSLCTFFSGWEVGGGGAVSFPLSPDMVNMLFFPLFTGRVEIEEWLDRVEHVVQPVVVEVFCRALCLLPILNLRVFSSAVAFLTHFDSKQNVQQARDNALKSDRVDVSGVLLIICSYLGHRGEMEEEWQSVSPIMEEVEGVVGLVSILQSTAALNQGIVRLADIVEHGPSVIREKVARHCRVHGELSLSPSSDPSLALLVHRLPFTLLDDAVAVEISWLNVRDWLSGEASLSRAVASCLSIQNASLRANTISFIWHKGVIGPLRALVEEGGHDKHIYNHLFPPNQKMEFVCACRQLLNGFPPRGSPPRGSPPRGSPPRGSRPFHPPSVEEFIAVALRVGGCHWVSESILDVVAREPDPDEGSLRLHKQLLAVLELEILLHVPHDALLFPQSQKDLFRPLSSQWRGGEYDAKANSRREDFIRKVILQSTESFSDTVSFLASEWNLTELVLFLECAILLRDGSDEEALFRMAPLDHDDQVALLSAALSGRMIRMSQQHNILIGYADKQFLEERVEEEWSGGRGGNAAPLSLSALLAHFSFVSPSDAVPFDDIATRYFRSVVL